jgi:hypothetical protein
VYGGDHSCCKRGARSGSRPSFRDDAAHRPEMMTVDRITSLPVLLVITARPQ